MRDREERWEGGGDGLLLLRLEMDGGALGNSAAMIAVGHVRGSASAIGSIEGSDLESISRWRPRRRASKQAVELPPKLHHSDEHCACQLQIFTYTTTRPA